MTVELLAEPNLEMLRLKGGCADSSKSTDVKMPHCWKYISQLKILVLFCNAVLGVLSCFTITWLRKKELVVLLLLYLCNLQWAFLRGIVGLSVVFDSGISW